MIGPCVILADAACIFNMWLQRRLTWYLVAQDVGVTWLGRCMQENAKADANISDSVPVVSSKVGPALLCHNL